MCPGVRKQISSSIAIFVTVVIAAFLSGCKTPQEFKQQADEEVYKAIDQKWKPEHGTMVNYRISDVEPAAGSIVLDPNWLPEGRLTLADAVAIATARSRDYQARKESLYATGLDLTLDRWEFAAHWFGTFDAGYSRDADDESLNAGGRFGFDKLLADGTQISAGITTDWLRFLTGDPRTSLGSVLTAGIAKPLLRGSSRQVVQENLTQSERNLLYEIRGFNRFRKEFVVNIVSGYFRVLEALDSVGNAESNYESLTLSYERARMRAEAGRVPPIEAAQTEQQMLQARDNLARAQRSYEQALDNFKLDLATPVDRPMQLDPNMLVEIASMQIVEPNFPVEDAVQTALASRLDLASSYDQVDDARRKVDVAIDALRARLDLVGSSAIRSTEPTDAARLQFHEGSYDVGMELELPLDQKSERNAFRRAQIAYTQAQRQYQQSVDEVKLEVRNAYRGLIEAARRYGIQKISLDLARRRVESASMLFEAGRAQARDLLEAQDALLSAQNETTATLVDYMIAKLSFYRDIELLKIRPDGLWEPLEDQNKQLF
ncbi:MAG: TolC family protein [Planctomycetaceae bacterium]|nr:TolC family protein [Planctomycetaceae bacterium]